MNPAQIRLSALYLQFVSWNPSFKQYVITMGFHSRHRSDEELRSFCARIQGKRSVLAIGSLALSYIFNESVHLN
ncbi:hypothetical protein GCM10028808_60680 [Spirosoma migulaei]